MEIKELNNNHRIPLFNIIDNIDLFNSEEKDCAKELIDIVLTNPEQKDYYINVLEDDNTPIGYYCCGQRPLTKHTWDLYWIVVARDKQYKGYGSLLLKHAEDFIIKQKGHLLLIETSSQPIYHTTVKFYIKNNYKIISRIKNFYNDNDDLIILIKYL